MNPQNSANWPLIVASFLVVASVVWIVGSRLIRRQVKRMTRRGAEREEEIGWEDRLSEHHFFRRMALVVPAVAVYLGAESTLGYLSVSGQFPDELGVAGVVVRRIAGALAVFAVARAFQALLDAADDIYNDRWAEAKTRPIKGYLQLVALAAWIVAVVVIVAIAIGQSPVTFLTGLGALAARQQRQHRIAPQLVVIVEVFVSQRQRVDPLRDQLSHPVFDAPRIAAVLETGRQARQQVDALVHLAQQQRAAIGADHPAVKASAHLAPKMPAKGEAGLDTLCNRRAACLVWR